MDREEILRTIKDKNINFFRLQFVDIFGFMKNIAMPISQIEKALAGKIMFDGSSIEGFVRINESDMYLKPDYSTFTILPWRDKFGSNSARIICDVHNADETPFIGCPRQNLRRVLANARKLGYTMNVGTECEFFLFKQDEKGQATTVTDDVAGYFDTDPADAGTDCRRKIIQTLETMGFEIEASHHETAIGQHEINFKYADALTAADNTVTFKWVVRTIAKEFSLHATFMPKPVFGISGSGMHTNQSLFTVDGKNAFFDPNTELQLSETALHYIAGLCKHAKGFCALTNPLVNSYKRLVSGYEAPVYIAWSASNRSALLRIPSSRGMSTRIEARNPDPTCNPYLAFAAMLEAGLDGVKNKLAAPPQTTADLYEMTAQERKVAGIECLPGNLREALECLKADTVIRESLGPHIFEKYVQGKEHEWDDYRMAVTDWEVRNYLSRF